VLSAAIGEWRGTDPRMKRLSNDGDTALPCGEGGDHNAWRARTKPMAGPLRGEERSRAGGRTASEGEIVLLEVAGVPETLQDGVGMVVGSEVPGASMPDASVELGSAASAGA